jgi:sugar O-acyltransferase (sialic acid O-acetyltransferase NeuD family)
MIRVIGLGAGGHARVVIDILRRMGGFDVAGLLDPRLELKGSAIDGVPVLGDDSLMPALVKQGIAYAFIGVGGAGAPRKRIAIHDRVRAEGFRLVSAIHPAAIVAASSAVGPAATIMAGAIINANASLGANVIVNTAAVVEHDCRLGDHVHVATGARLAGGVQVGDGTLVGLGALVRQGISIGRFSIVGAGAVVVDDVPDHVVVIGTPARIARAVVELV